MSAEAYCVFDLVPPPGMSPGDVGRYIAKILRGNMEGPGKDAVAVGYVGSFPFRKARIEVKGSDDEGFFREAITDVIKRSYWDID